MTKQNPPVMPQYTENGSLARTACKVVQKQFGHKMIQIVFVILFQNLVVVVTVIIFYFWKLYQIYIVVESEISSKHGMAMIEEM